MTDRPIAVQNSLHLDPLLDHDAVVKHRVLAHLYTDRGLVQHDAAGYLEGGGAIEI